MSLMAGIKEGTDCMEHWVLYENNESWNTTSKINDVLYGNKTFKITTTTTTIIKKKKTARRQAS